jgi:hypothetical protein
MYLKYTGVLGFHEGTSVYLKLATRAGALFSALHLLSTWDDNMNGASPSDVTTLRRRVSTASIV